MGRFGRDYRIRELDAHNEAEPSNAAETRLPAYYSKTRALLHGGQNSTVDLGILIRRDDLCECMELLFT